MKKIKTFEAPNKKDWEKKEFLAAKKALSEVTGEPYSPFVFCYSCKKQVETFVLHVVNFGKDVACGTCYRKKWSKIKTRMAKFAIPDKLDPFFDDQPSTEQYEKQVQEDKQIQEESIAKVNELQKEHCDELRDKMEKADFKP